MSKICACCLVGDLRGYAEVQQPEKEEEKQASQNVNVGKKEELKKVLENAEFRDLEREQKRLGELVLQMEKQNTPEYAKAIEIYGKKCKELDDLYQKLGEETGLTEEDLYSELTLDEMTEQQARYLSPLVVSPDSKFRPKSSALLARIQIDLSKAGRQNTKRATNPRHWPCAIGALTYS